MSKEFEGGNLVDMYEPDPEGRFSPEHIRTMNEFYSHMREFVTARKTKLDDLTIESMLISLGEISSGLVCAHSDAADIFLYFFKGCAQSFERKMKKLDEAMPGHHGGEKVTMSFVQVDHDLMDFMEDVKPNKIN